MVSRSVNQFRSWLDTVAVLGHISQDREAMGHNRRVAQLCVHIGRQMAMTTTELRVLARAGLLHDIGKMGIPDQVLDKRAPLDEAEWALIRSHPEIGLSLLGKGRSRREMLAVLYHHERMDGSGYPYGLIGDAIPIEARVVAVADTYDALTSDRTYRKARSSWEARQVIFEEGGSRLDSRVVMALMHALDAPGGRQALHRNDPLTRYSSSRSWLAG